MRLTFARPRWRASRTFLRPPADKRRQAGYLLGPPAPPLAAVKLKVDAAHSVPCITLGRRTARRHGAGAFVLQSRQVGESRLGGREHRAEGARFAGLRRHPGGGPRRPPGGISPSVAASRRRTDPRVDSENW